MSNTIIVKAGVISEYKNKSDVQYTVWAQTWDGQLYYEVGDALLTTHSRCLDRVKEALSGEHVNNGSWCRANSVLV